jgi:hypothetical protein
VKPLIAGLGIAFAFVSCGSGRPGAEAPQYLSIEEIADKISCDLDPEEEWFRGVNDVIVTECGPVRIHFYKSVEDLETSINASGGDYLEGTIYGSNWSIEPHEGGANMEEIARRLGGDLQ